MQILMRVQDVAPPLEASEAYRAQLELYDELWIPENRGEREDLADLAIKAAQECNAIAESAHAQGDELNAELNQQRAKSIFADIVRLTISDMRGALRAKYPNLSDDAADDILQEAYVNAYQSFPRFGQKGQFHAWMYRITMNEAFDQFKKHKKNAHDVIEDLPPAEEHKHASVYVVDYSGDSKQILIELLKELKPDVREMIWLRHVEGYSFPLVAEMVGKKESAVKVRVHRALIKLRQALKERGISPAELLN
jgi:RNA polymerase sigma-70 factor, ECF subfamily